MNNEEKTNKIIDYIFETNTTDFINIYNYAKQNKLESVFDNDNYTEAIKTIANEIKFKILTKEKIFKNTTEIKIFLKENYINNIYSDDDELNAYIILQELNNK